MTNDIDLRCFDHEVFSSVDKLKEAVLKVCDTYPDNRNPVVGSSCVYDDGQGNHCLLGQVMVDVGAPLPNVQSGIGSLGIMAKADMEVISSASLWQALADHWDKPESECEDELIAAVDATPVPRRRWADVAAMIRKDPS